MFEDIKEHRETLLQSPTCELQVIELRNPLPSGQTVALLKTVSNLSLPPLLSESDIYLKLSQYPKLFPSMYASRIDQGKLISQYIFEYFPDGSLVNLIKGRKKLFSAKRGHILVVKMLEAVVALHSSGIAHCNINLNTVCVVGTNGFKLGGDYRYSVQTGVLQRDIERNEDSLFANDVFNLGIVILQFFAVETSPLYLSLSEEKKFETVDYKLRNYPELFGRTVAGMLKEMIREDSSLRPTAKCMLERIRTLDFRSLNSTVISSQPSLNLQEVIRLNNSDALSISQSLSSIAQLPSLQSMSSGKSIASVSESSFHPIRQVLKQQLDHEYKLLFSKLQTSIEVQHIEDQILATHIESIFKKLNSTGGHVEIELIIEEFTCQGCHSKKLVSDRATIPICQHVLCKACLNLTIVRCLTNYDSANKITCPIDNMPFKPLKNFADKHLLEVHIIKRLDEAILREKNYKCPECKSPYDLSAESEPVTIRCPNCRRCFCSYCRKSAHSSICALWATRKKISATS